MVFSSTTFLFLFLPVVLLVYYNPIIKSRGFRNGFLLLSSLLFYGWGEPVFVFLMIFSIFVTWLCGLYIGHGTGKKVLVIGTIYHIIVLFIFKYLTFCASQLGLLLNQDFSLISISLPIGISFFTFQLMSYLFDVYYGKAQTQRNPFYVGLYVSLFPQLIAGPIVRYEEVEQEIKIRHESYDDICQGMMRFIYGLGKKILISNYMAQIADNCFDYLSNMSVAMAWLGAIAYTLQIYFDFSGYSDMAIGLGRMFGFHFSENFNYPYISRSITEFWRRWHMSLSTWFRDYVYIPLGGNRVSKRRWAWNLFVVWLLTGIWHGANWTFIAWGLLYYCFLLFEKQTNLVERLGKLSHVYTLGVVVLLWVIFRASDLSSAVTYIGNMFGIGANGLVDSAVIGYLRNTWSVLLMALIGSTPVVKNLFAKLNDRGLGWIEPIWVTVVFVISVLQAVSSTYNPFIYFNF